MGYPNPEPGTITAGQASRLLSLSHERLRQLAADGWFPAAIKGRYSLVAVVQGYIRFLTDESRRAARSKADADLTAARTREIELRIAEREERLVETDVIVADVAYMFTVHRESLAGLGRKSTRDHALAARIDAAATAAIDRAERRFAEAIAALRAGRDRLSSDNAG